MSPKEISTIFAGSGVGMVVMVLPVVYALHYFGSRLVFGGLLLCSAVATCSAAILAHIGPLWMVPARVVQGMTLSSSLPLLASNLYGKNFISPF